MPCLGRRDTRILLLGPSDPWIGILSQKLSVYPSRVNGVLHAKCQPWRQTVWPDKQAHRHVDMQTATFIMQTSLFTCTLKKITTLIIQKARYEESAVQHAK